jgi:hypothetical protein
MQQLTAVLFMIMRGCRQLYERFFEAFASMGEPNIPIDREIMQTAEFYDLLDRLRLHADQNHRDHWCGWFTQCLWIDQRKK